VWRLLCFRFNCPQRELYVQGFIGENPITLAAEGVYNFQMDPVDDATGYSWSLPSGFSFSGSTTTSYFASIWTPNQNGTFTLRVRPYNNCGDYGQQTLTIYITGAGGGSRGGLPNCPNPPCQISHSARVAGSDSDLSDDLSEIQDELLNAFHINNEGLF